MKTNKLSIVAMACSFALLISACSPSSENNSSLAEMNKALNVASNTMTSFEQKNTPANQGTKAVVNEANAMDVFAKDYAKNLNQDPSLAHLGTIGVKPEADGSFSAFGDTNKNQIKDANEKELFKLELDAENNRLVASNENGVQEQPQQMGMGTGLLMGMLLGNMLSRQRMTGANPASRKATPRARTMSPNKNTSNSMRSRAGSGSHASGK